MNTPTLPSLLAINIEVVHILILVFNVISQENVTKVSSNIMGRSPSKLVIILSILVAKDTEIVET